MFSTRTNWRLAPNALSRVLRDVRASGRRFRPHHLNPTKRVYVPIRCCACRWSIGKLFITITTRGLLEARNAFANTIAKRIAFSISIRAAVLTTSTSEAYSYVFRCCAIRRTRSWFQPVIRSLSSSPISAMSAVPYPLSTIRMQIDFDSLYKRRLPLASGNSRHPNNQLAPMFPSRRRWL